MSPYQTPNRRPGIVSVAVILLATLTLWSDTAQAAGFFLPGRGVRPMGRAGTFVASGEGDLNSVWYNPANAAGFDSFTLLIDLSVIDLDLEFHRAPRELANGQVRTYEPIANTHPAQAIPQLLVGGPAWRDDVWWSAGLFTPYQSPSRYPENGAQRYTLIDTQGSLMGTIHAGLAWQATDWLRVGAGLQNFMAHFRIVNMGSGYTGMFGEPEDEDLDFLTQVEMSDYFNLTGNLGAQVTLHPNVSLGLALQLPVTVRDPQARFKARFPTHPFFDNAYVTNDRIGGEAPMPLIARAGLRYAAERWDLELTASYEGWSRFDTIRVTQNDVQVKGVPGIDAFEIPPLAIPQNFRDTFSIGLGGEWQTTDRLALRSGYTFERGAMPDTYVSVFAPDSDKHMLGLGLSYRLGTFALDLGASYIHMAERTITDSDVRQINPGDPDRDLSVVVGNGTYRTRYLMFGVGVRY